MATFTVTNGNDSGEGSLRQAILNANKTTEYEGSPFDGPPIEDVIEFDPGLSGETITLTSGELVITGDLTINGLGANELTISGNNASRVFKIENPFNLIEVEIEGLTIADGNTTNGGSGIHNEGSNLTISNSVISNNQGSGIINNYVLVGNSTFNGVVFYENGNLKVNNSIISNNQGSGIVNKYTFQDDEYFLYSHDLDDLNSGNVIVTNSIISNNQGSGISNFDFGNLIVTSSTISNNLGARGINTYDGNVTVTNSMITGNTGGGIYSYDSNVTVTDTSITNNTTNGDGGGIYSFDSRLIINNSTVSSNQANGSGGGITQYTFGPGRGYTRINNSTITGNIADADGNGGNNIGYNYYSYHNGGGISNVLNQRVILFFGGYGHKINVTNTIVAGNFDNTDNYFDDPFLDTAPRHFQPDVQGYFISGGYNLIGDGTGSTGFTAAGDQVGSSDNPIFPLLGTLQNNGGSTLTQALLPDSPAINSGAPNFTLPPEFDQRGTGFDRVVDGRIDIGAFESDVDFYTNNEPVANDDSATTDEDTPININVLANDSDANGDNLSLTILTAPNNGSAVVDNNDTPNDLTDDFITYTPDPNFNDNDSFTYQVDDGNGGINTATVEVTVNTGNIIIIGTRQGDTLLGASGDDTLDGRGGDDNIQGNEGDDVLKGTSGFDNLDGGEGNDKLIGGADADTLIGGEGKDTLSGGKGNDILSGGKGNDILLGVDGNDSLNGGEGNDYLNGGGGDDQLWGSLGDDILDGKEGSDIFVLAVGEGIDTIKDFNLDHGDLIGLSGSLSFNDLYFESNQILVGTDILAELRGFDTTILNSSNFVIV